MNERHVHLTPRLSVASEMLRGYEIIADIGCDHGRLVAALLQSGACNRVIASDISEPSLDKARELIRYIGLSDRVSFRVGDGCAVLHPCECQAIAMLGIGGTLMCRILDACDVPLMGAECAVLQPMRAQDNIRRYLHRKCYHIVEDRIVNDHGRLYQVFKAVPGKSIEPLPEGFPVAFYDVGYRSFADRDPLLSALCRQQLKYHEINLADNRGTAGESYIRTKVHALRQILAQIEQGDTI